MNYFHNKDVRNAERKAIATKIFKTIFVYFVVLAVTAIILYFRLR